jgi:hypothetical protein
VTEQIPMDELISLHELLLLIIACETIDNCDAGSHGRNKVGQQVTFDQLPPVLIFHLYWFEFSCTKKAVIEQRNQFNCSYDLNIVDFVESPESEPNYELYAISAHRENLVFGYDTLYIRCNHID